MLKSNYNQISKSIGYTDESDLSGKLMASHLGGFGNTKKLFLEGKGFKDAYGTDIMQYYKLGSKAGSNDETLSYLPKKFQGKISNLVNWLRLEKPSQKWPIMFEVSWLSGQTTNVMVRITA